MKQRTGNVNRYGPRLKDEEVFVANSTYPRHVLKARIMKQGLLPNVCAVCSMLPVWNGKPLTLILDHINGVNNDNRIQNLRLICHNCDSQLDTYKSRNRK